MSDKIVTFLGCGSWGAALGAILAEKGIFVRYWHRNESAINEMQSSRKHYLLNDIDFNERDCIKPYFPRLKVRARKIYGYYKSRLLKNNTDYYFKNIDPPQDGIYLQIMI